MHLIIISVAHRTLLHHWYVLSQMTGSQAQLVKKKKVKSVIFNFLLKEEFTSKGTLSVFSPLILHLTILF